MKISSIRFKLVLLFVGAFAITIAAVLVVSDRQLSAMADRHQDARYAEKVDGIWNELDRMNSKLLMTGLVDAYAADFHRSALRDIRNTYYESADDETYPLILDGQGNVLLKPPSSRGNSHYATLAIPEKVDALPAGAFTDLDGTPQTFYVYRHYAPWNWTILYQVPLSIKYAESKAFSRVLIIVMTAIAIAVACALVIVLSRLTKPIEELTALSLEIAGGKLNREVKARGNDEFSVLASSFEKMRLAVKNQIASLENEVEERKRAEERIRQFRSALEASTDAVGMSTPEGKHYYQNPAFDRLFGKVGEVGEDPPATLYVDQVVGREVFETIMVGESWIGEVQMYDCDRSIRDILLRAYAIKDNAGSVMGLVGVHTDITDRRRSEEQLRKNEENLRVTLDSIGDGVIATDIDGRIIRMNPVAETMTGWILDDARGRLLPEVFHIVHVQSRILWENPIERVLASGDIVELADNALLVSRDGLEYRIADSGAPIRKEDGEAIGVVIVFRDITEEQLLREKLQQSQKMDAIGQLAGGIAHDFNNMLAGILGSAELLKPYLSEKPEAETFHTLIVESAERAAGLTQKLLSFARNQPSSEIPLNVHQVIFDAVALLKGSLDRRIRIDLDLADDECCVQGDSVQLQNALLNLGINASHAMPAGGCITISTRTTMLDAAHCENNPFEVTPGDYVEINVSDSGCGIPSEHLPKIFEPFFTTKPQGGGTGLGLAAVYGTVRQHRGEIIVSSEVGKGSTFVILLPRCLRSMVGDTRDPSLQMGTGRILVVEDEETLRITAEAILKRLGYDVILAKDGKEGLAIYTQDPDGIDLVMLDMVMPEMDGKDCFEAMKAVKPGVKVVLASGYSREEDVSEMKKGGIFGFIRKPYKATELGRLIHDALQDVS